MCIFRATHKVSCTYCIFKAIDNFQSPYSVLQYSISHQGRIHVTHSALLKQNGESHWPFNARELRQIWANESEEAHELKPLSAGPRLSPPWLTQLDIFLLSEGSRQTFQNNNNEKRKKQQRKIKNKTSPNRTARPTQQLREKKSLYPPLMVLSLHCLHYRGATAEITDRKSTESLSFLGEKLFITAGAWEPTSPEPSAWISLITPQGNFPCHCPPPLP